MSYIFGHPVLQDISISHQKTHIGRPLIILADCVPHALLSFSERSNMYSSDRVTLGLDYMFVQSMVDEGHYLCRLLCLVLFLVPVHGRVPWQRFCTALPRSSRWTPRHGHPSTPDRTSHCANLKTHTHIKSAVCVTLM